MIKVIIGKKGSGKTKYMIEEVNTAVKEEPGCLVFLSKGNRLMYDLAHNVRLIHLTSLLTAHGKLLTLQK